MFRFLSSSLGGAARLRMAKATRSPTAHGEETAQTEPAMNSGSWRSGRGWVGMEITRRVVPDWNQRNEDKSGPGRSTDRLHIRNTLRHAQGRQRTGLLTIRLRLLLRRTARHALRHIGHVFHRRHRRATHRLPDRWGRHWGGDKAQDREDREQPGQEGSDIHGRRISYCAGQGKTVPITLTYRRCRRSSEIDEAARQPVSSKKPGRLDG